LTKIRAYGRIATVRHVGTVKGRIRQEAGGIADCPDAPGRIADLTAKNAARPDATEGIEPRISPISRRKKIFQRKVAKSQRRKEGIPIPNRERLRAFAPLRLSAACPSGLRSSRNCAILKDSIAKNTKRGFFFVLFAFFVVKEFSSDCGTGMAARGSSAFAKATADGKGSKGRANQG